MKLKLIWCFILLLEAAFAQTIPTGRTFDWSHSGYPDSIPNPSNVVDVTTFGAVGDSTTDNYTAIMSAINSLAGGRGVVYFPSGSYLIGTTLQLPDSVILRGNSSDSTRLIFNLSGAVANSINITGTVAGFTPVLNGHVKGSNYIAVADTAGFSIDGYAEIREENGAWDTQPVSWADYSVGQIIRITGISGDTLFFEQPLRIDYDSLLHPEIRPISPRHEVGIECLKISRTDNVTTGVCIGVYFSYAVNCWIKGIESDISIGSHIELDACSDISIFNSYLHHAYLYDGVSTHGYGITLFAHTGQCRIENNILRYLRHSISLQTGANGNVIAYNYSREPNRSEPPANYGADISLHGHYPFANLFEGNIVQNIMIDQTWGPSGPYNTFFRNRAELWGIMMTSGTVESDYQNFVGNEITNASIPYGNYILYGANNFAYGNNVHGTIMPSGTTNLPDSSYYLTTPPSFWTTSIWPNIGEPNAIGSGSIPAKDRYTSGLHLADCTLPIIPGMINTEITNQIYVYPNPATGTIHLQNASSENADVLIFDSNGRLMVCENIKTGREINLSQILQQGFYNLVVRQQNSVYHSKLIIERN